jgi:hypothetical protein
MNNYSVRVQVVVWYEVAVKARTRDDAITNAEGLQPDYIQSVGIAVEAETGLADPESVHAIGTA